MTSDTTRQTTPATAINWPAFILAGLLVGACAGFVVYLRSLPCAQHKDGEQPLVEVAKQSAKMNGAKRVISPDEEHAP